MGSGLAILRRSLSAYRETPLHPESQRRQRIGVWMFGLGVACMVLARWWR
jgi:hypothetical protein